MHLFIIINIIIIIFNSQINLTQFNKSALLWNSLIQLTDDIYIEILSPISGANVPSEFDAEIYVDFSNSSIKNIIECSLEEEEEEEEEEQPTTIKTTTTTKAANLLPLYICISIDNDHYTRECLGLIMPKTI